MKLLLGLDEVGRGPLAGPVVTGCVVFSINKKFKVKINSSNNINKFIVLGDDILITDSKKMTSNQRDVASKWIKENADSFGTGVGSVSKINNEGIVKATNFAFRSAFHACKIRDSKDIKEILIDAFYVPRLGNIKKSMQTPIVHGDALKFEIAAASIIAKVYRDNLMKKLATIHPQYGWEKNKGYGTKSHQEAIKTFGKTKFHRDLYLRKILD